MFTFHPIILIYCLWAKPKTKQNASHPPANVAFVVIQVIALPTTFLFYTSTNPKQSQISAEFHSWLSQEKNNLDEALKNMGIKKKGKDRTKSFSFRFNRRWKECNKKHIVLIVFLQSKHISLNLCSSLKKLLEKLERHLLYKHQNKCM